MQRITESPLTTCRVCNGPLKKLISNTSFQLKGTGWYVTDYARRSGNNGSGKKDKKDSASAEKDTHRPSSSESSSTSHQDSARSEAL